MKNKHDESFDNELDLIAGIDFSECMDLFPEIEEGDCDDVEPEQLLDEDGR